jgi:hypothetical protein
MTADDRELSTGYAAVIHRSLTEPKLRWGVPTMLRLAWLAIFGLAFLVTPLSVRWRLLLVGVPAALTLLGMIRATRRDPQWPDLITDVMSEPNVFHA